MFKYLYKRIQFSSYPTAYHAGMLIIKMTKILLTYSESLSSVISSLIQISLKFVYKGPVDNKSTFFDVVPGWRIGDKPLLEPMDSVQVYVLHEA